MHYAMKKGLAILPAPLSTHNFCAGLLSRSSGSHGRGRGSCADVDLDLLWFRFLALRNVEREHAILIVGLDGLRVHGIREREAASERTIRALHAQIVVLIHFLLELAFSANREDVVLDADV